MRYSNSLFMFGMTFPFLVACSGDATVGEELVDARLEALTTTEEVTGFESLGAWSVSGGKATLSLSRDHADGSWSLSVAPAYNSVTIRSSPAQAPAVVDATIGLRVKPPVGHKVALWKGLIRLYVDSPSRNLSALVGEASLDVLSEGAFGTLGFAVSDDVRSAFKRSSVADVQYTLQFTVPLTAPYLVDGLRLGSEAVQPVPTPSAFVGGRDIALVWEPMPWSRTTARYQVMRNGSFVAALPDNPNVRFPNTYVDEDVVPGRTYTYRVLAVDSNGKYSSASAPVTVTHPSDGAPVPSVTIDSSKITLGMPNRDMTLAAFEKGKRFLETWYPKAVQLLALPGHQPPTQLVIEGEPNCGGGWAWPREPTVHICDGSASDMGLYAHEATHVTQGYETEKMPGLGESVASWIGELSTGNPTHRPPSPLMSYYDDYEFGAYFYDWVSRAYDKPRFVRDLNQAALLGHFDGDWIAGYTGRTLGQLYGEMVGTGFSSPGALRNAAGLYAFPQDSDLTIGSSLYMLSSTPTNNERFFQGQMRDGRGLLRWEKTACFGEDAQYRVVITDCSDVPEHRWRYADRHFYSPSGRCMQAQSGANGALVVTAPCSASVAAQYWVPLPL